MRNVCRIVGAVLLLAMLLVAGCNTIAGLGRDLTSLGQGTQSALAAGQSERQRTEQVSVGE